MTKNRRKGSKSYCSLSKTQTKRGFWM